MAMETKYNSILEFSIIQQQMSQKTTIKNPKSYSLPKLTDHSSPGSNRKPLKQFHKVNWSIAPRCLLEGHEGQPVIYVCVRKECQCITRLVCEQCFYHTHAHHNKNFMAIDEVKVGKVRGLRYWPFDPEYKPIFEFIKSHDAYIQNLIRDIQSTYQNLLKSVTQTIQQARDKYLSRIQKFYTKQTQKQTYITQLTHSIQKYFNFKQIQNCVRQIFNKQMRHDIFVRKMNAIMKDGSHLEAIEKMRKEFYDQAIDKGRDMGFDMVYFIKKQKILLREIGEMDNAVVEERVVVDQAAIGIENIIVQTVEYLKKTSEGLYPLAYDEKELEDGTYYNGFICKGNRTLLGIRDYRNGFVYFGEWRTNCRNGWGVYEHKENGYRYAGHWKEDKKNGYGKEVTPTYTYEGNFVNDKKEGFGSIRQDGIRFDITWKNDKKNGKGKRFDSSGETEVYYLNGVESQVKGGLMPNNGQGQKRDVNFLARMFANGQ